MTLHDPFGRVCPLPAVAAAGKDRYSRAARVALLAEFFQDLMAERMPRREVVLFAAGGGLAWLEQGGSLTRDYWRTAGPQGSTHTESVIWRQLPCSSRRATDARDGATIAAPHDQPEPEQPS